VPGVVDGLVLPGPKRAREPVQRGLQAEVGGVGPARVGLDAHKDGHAVQHVAQDEVGARRVSRPLSHDGAKPLHRVAPCWMLHAADPVHERVPEGMDPARLRKPVAELPHVQRGDAERVQEPRVAPAREGLEPRVVVSGRVHGHHAAADVHLVFPGVREVLPQQQACDGAVVDGVRRVELEERLAPPRAPRLPVCDELLDAQAVLFRRLHQSSQQPRHPLEPEDAGGGLGGEGGVDRAQLPQKYRVLLEDADLVEGLPDVHGTVHHSRGAQVLGQRRAGHVPRGQSLGRGRGGPIGQMAHHEGAHGVVAEVEGGGARGPATRV
jgi:hypothetical protein